MLFRSRCVGGINLIRPFPQVSLVEEAGFFLCCQTCVLMWPFVALCLALPNACLKEISSLFKQLPRCVLAAATTKGLLVSRPSVHSSKKLPGISVLLARMFHFALASKCLSSEALGASVTPIQLLSLRMSILMRPSAPCSLAFAA